MSPTKRIERLTPEQEIDLRRTYEDGLAIGRDITPIDHVAVADVVGKLYARIGEPQPAVLIFSSPFMCVLASGALRQGCRLLSPLDSLWSQLRSQLGSQLDSQLRSQLGSQLESQLDSQLWSQLRSQLDSQLRSQLGSQLRFYFAGQQWCAWEVFYDFCRRIGVQYTSDESALLDLWLAQSRACHWWWPYKGLVLASARPTALRVDEQGRLHATDGLAVAYSDGWGIHAVHGVRVPADIIEQPASITVARIQAEQNAEIRRVMVERYGLSRYIHDSGALPIHADECGTLYRQELAGDEPLVMVSVLNSTPEPSGERKQYMLRVPPTITTAREAVAWTFAVEADAYRPAVET